MIENQSSTEPAIPRASESREAAGAGAARSALPERPRIVIVRFTSLGDVVKATILPRLIRARYPRAHLTMITAEAHLPLIADNPHLDRAIGFERRVGLGGLRILARNLRAGGVDLVVDVHRSLRSRLLTWWIGAPGVPYSKRSWARWMLVYFGWNLHRPRPRKDQDFAAALAAWGVADDGRGTEIHLPILEPQSEFSLKFAAPLAMIGRWRARGLPVIGLAPVAAWPLKRWPPRHVREWMELYVRETGGGIVLFGGANDRDVPPLAQGLEPHVVSLVGDTSLLESARFAALCDVMIANDTGMSHLAEAVGRDVIVLFGPTTEEWGYFPVRPGSAVIQRDLPCRPCSRMGEGRCTHPLFQACLTGIAPDAVQMRVKAQLARLRGAPVPPPP